jgi:hypothetical protein
MARRISFTCRIDTSNGTRNDRQQRQRDVIVAPMPLGKPKPHAERGPAHRQLSDSA